MGIFASYKLSRSQARVLEEQVVNDFFDHYLGSSFISDDIGQLLHDPLNLDKAKNIGDHDHNTFWNRAYNASAPLMLPVSHICMKFKQDQVAYLDPLCRTMISTKGPDRVFCSPLARSVSELSQRLISNKKPVVFFKRRGYGAQKAFSQLLSFLEGRQPLESIIIEGPSNEKMAEFSSIPDVRRFFVLGSNELFRSEFQQQTAFRIVGQYYCEFLDQHFNIGQFQTKDGTFLKLIDEQNKQSQFYLLSCDKQALAVDICNSFFADSVDLMTDLSAPISQRLRDFEWGPAFLKGGRDSLRKLIETFFWRFVVHGAPEEVANILRPLLSLSGCVRVYDTAIILDFSSESEVFSENFVSSLAGALNQLQIVAPNGRRVLARKSL